MKIPTSTSAESSARLAANRSLALRASRIVGTRFPLASGLVAACLTVLPATVHAAAPPAALPADLTPGLTAHARAPDLNDASLHDVEAAIREVLRSPTIAGHSVSAHIIALSSGQTVFSTHEDRVLKPASNTKVVSTAAAFGVLGPDWRTASRLLSEKPPKDGTIQGDLVLDGSYDLSWSTLFYPIPHYVANRLVDQLVAQGVRRIDGDVVVRGTFVVDGHRFGTLNTHQERLQAANMFQARLRAKGIQVTGVFRTSDAAPPRGFSHQLALWEGPTLPSIAAHINRMSHNEFADMVMLAIGAKANNEGTYASGFRAVEAWLDHVGVAHDGLRLHDGSGLSHNNRISANQLTHIIRAVQSQPWAELWNHSLSVAGVDGTFAARMREPGTRGCAWMKSGTIDGVITTAGILHHRGTGERYAVAVLMNDIRHQPSARAAQDAIINALGGHQLQQTRPAAPALSHATLNDRDEVVLRWDSAPRAAHYVIESRDAHSTWRTELVVDGQRHDAIVPRGATPRSYRLIATNDQGLSDPSVVLIAGGPKRAPKVLVVDGNERWQHDPAPENGLKSPHAFLAEFMEPLTGYRVESISNRALTAMPALTDTTVLVALGEEARSTEALAANEREWVQRYVRAGGRLIVAGSEAAWDLATNVPDGEQFLDRVFGAAFVSDNAGNTAACLSDSDPSHPQCGHFWTPGFMKVEWPDQLRATRGNVCMHYAGTEDVACVVHKSAAIVGFPLESIDNPADRRTVVRALLTLVGTPKSDDRS